MFLISIFSPHTTAPKVHIPTQFSKKEYVEHAQYVVDKQGKQKMNNERESVLYLII